MPGLLRAPSLPYLPRLARIAQRKGTSTHMAQQFLEEMEAAGQTEPAELRELVEYWVERQFPGVALISPDTLQSWLADRPQELLLLVSAIPVGVMLRKPCC